MCGIAGYSFGSDSRVDRTLAAQALLAGIAERGADAVGYAFGGDGPLAIHKQQTGASALLETVVIPSTARHALVHVRDYTKGHPTISANNHPVRHGSVVGIHNGIIANDEELFVRHSIERHEPGMTVDSEVIFALVDAHGSHPAVLEELVGAMAAAWVDERDGALLHVARGIGRPLWLAHGRHEVLFASTREALEVVERALRTTFRKSQLEEGRVITVTDGELVDERRWSPDRSYREERALPAVRAPNEGRSCLDRLWAIAAPA